MRILIILTIFFSFVNCVFAQESAFSDSADKAPDLSNIQFSSSDTQVSTVSQAAENSSPAQDITLDSTATGQTSSEVVSGSLTKEISKSDIYAGIKIKAFDNKFVFQVEKKKINTSANLNLKEIILGPGSLMAPPNGLQLASRVYEYDFSPAQDVNLSAKTLWISVKYDSADYYRKNLYYFDEAKGEWAGIKGTISNGASKIIATVTAAKAKVAILENIDIMTEGSASWYKYKSCDCAASPDYPKGTKLKVTNLENNKSVIVKVNDWGPDRSVFPDRVIDLDVVAFKKIAKKSQGLCRVKVELAETLAKK